MAIDYAKMQQLAQRLIEQSGRSVTLQRLSRKSDDPDKPWRGTADLTPADEEVIVSAVFLDTISSRYLGLTIQKEGFGDEGSAQYVIVSTLSAPANDLKVFDRLIDGYQAYQISAINILKPGGTEMFVAFVANKRELIK